MKDKLSEFRQLLDKGLSRAREVYLPLRECMRAYSLGVEPVL